MHVMIEENKKNNPWSINNYFYFNNHIN
jgi:hypothetical protein